jgi:hypothetical protein
MKFKSLIFLLIATFTVIACSTKKKAKHARLILETYENGNYKTVHQYFKDTGDMTEDYYYQEFYENGNLKIQSLENQGSRKGECNYYFENGNIKAKLNFKDDVLNGPAVLYNANGKIKATDMAINGTLKQNNIDIMNFILKNIDNSDNRANWIDSMNNSIDSLKSALNKIDPH